MKRLLLAAIALLTSPLLAETVGKINFQLPPSNYEWKVLVDNGAVEVDTDIDKTGVLYTHREGDALEIFIATDCIVTPDEEDLRNPKQTVVQWLFGYGDQAVQEVVQGQLDQLGFFFKNHEFRLTDIIESSDDEIFFGWDLFDGEEDLLHGFCRAFRTTDGFAVLHYATTAPATLRNLSTWGNALNQATRD